MAARFSLVLLAVGLLACGEPPGGSDARNDAAAGVKDLYQEIEAGRVRLISARGNGSSSGAAVEASLRNETASEMRLSIHLTRPMYLINSGRGQNMIAAQVLEAGGAYLREGDKEFIRLPPREEAQVLMIAFCADFDRANPSSEDRFTVGSVPTHLQSVAANIVAALEADPNADLNAAGQLAVWLAQGVGLEEIRPRFDFTAQDVVRARTLLP